MSNKESNVALQTLRVTKDMKDFLSHRIVGEPPANIKIEYQKIHRYRTCVCPSTGHISELCPSGDLILSLGAHRNVIAAATVYDVVKNKTKSTTSKAGTSSTLSSLGLSGFQKPKIGSKNKKTMFSKQNNSTNESDESEGEEGSSLNDLPKSDLINAIMELASQGRNNSKGKGRRGGKR
uniref:RNA-binding protein n=1 Tax=Wound tumor virus (strain NJ) TaxID=31595 RepID=NSP11_WTVNJ|nr:RecName: Full=RNA-binding protein; AltName: Full=Non-structural protein 12; Short=Pns12 [Wound tumor virus (strain NJ)]AAA48501.1 ORF3; putative [Wound tumor virus]